ncbi:hypothetical protein PCANC_21486, partial [Puccinia coronata f. sp. avenae]
PTPEVVSRTPALAQRVHFENREHGFMMGFPPVGCIGLPQSAIAPSRDGIGVKLYHWDKQIGTLFPSVSPAGMYVAARSTPSRLIWAIVTRAASPTHMGSSSSEVMFRSNSLLRH